MRLDLVFPRFKLLSGAERLILGLAAALVDGGHRPRVVCHQFDRSCEPLLADGVELAESGRRLDWSRNRYWNAPLDYVRVFQLRRLLDPRADVVVLYGPALPLAWRLRRREGVLYHCFEPPRALYQDRDDVLARAGRAGFVLRAATALYRRLDRRLVRLVDGVTASGPYAARRVREVYGVGATPITHGIDRWRLDAARARAAEPRHDLVSVNYLHPRKRVDLIIRAVARLGEKTGAAPSLEVVGDGPERARLSTLALELGIERRVRFAGFVPEEDLADHYCGARCYVHAAREESFGLSVIEAAYCELPVVAVAEGGVVDNVEDGVTGALVESTATGLAAGIRRVLGSDDGGRSLGLVGHRMVSRRYRWELGAEDLLRAAEAAR